MKDLQISDKMWQKLERHAHAARVSVNDLARVILIEVIENRPEIMDEMFKKIVLRVSEARRKGDRAN